MQTTRPLLARGFLARSMDELRRRSSIAWNLEAVKGPQGPRPLYDFRTEERVRDCILMSDALIGGCSSGRLDYVSRGPGRAPASFARFHGHISTALPPDRPGIQRSGYAAWRTPDQPPTLFGKAVWDIDPYTYLALRIKSDGRAYLVNLQTEAVEPTYLHQHRLFAKRPGQWETVLVKWNDFVRTNYGFVVEPQTELLRQKVRSVGVGLTDRVEGPFELCVERVWATNQVDEGAPVVQSEESELKNRKGERIQW
ncbi:Complex I intermediate-associated protein 30, mitochondrial [Tolypocladium ophioglossoides CBS 100239]|uniref:Complex I intermediate-associated protein 30, mitochondrial n=1 Tax=Tolypocladium ophioglossoides (strain CBS 100239) TaxID=1163406 RepID=A0A0L0N8J7_TOLOC|nr:Complex I intermediate-associated protein 30, mitochondrial [Tolypocladium ophioglossoides CBS 100239]